MVKLAQQFFSKLLTNGLSVFGYFMGLVLKGLHLNRFHLLLTLNKSSPAELALVTSKSLVDFGTLVD